MFMKKENLKGPKEAIASVFPNGYENPQEYLRQFLDSFPSLVCKASKINYKIRDTLNVDKGIEHRTCENNI